MKQGVDPLYDAIVASNVVAATEAIASMNDIADTRIDGKSYLRIAAEHGQPAIARLLVNHGADINERNGVRRYSLLHNAVAASNYGLARFLSELGADPSPRTTSGATPLHFAARSGQAYMALRLLESKADINAQDSQGRTPILLAVTKADIEMVRLLVKHDCNTELADRCGRTPSLLARQLGHNSLASHIEQTCDTGFLAKVAEQRSSNDVYSRR